MSAGITRADGTVRPPMIPMAPGSNTGPSDSSSTVLVWYAGGPQNPKARAVAGTIHHVRGKAPRERESDRDCRQR